MIGMYNAQALLAETRLRESMLLDRSLQFVQRHRWALELDKNGLEQDEYDDKASTYCIASTNGRHDASIRIRSESDGSMVEKHFPSFWNLAKNDLIGSYEVTRFCTSPNLTSQKRNTAVLDVLLGLCRHCLRNQIESFFGVVYPSVQRTLKKYGWPGQALLRSNERGSRSMLLCRWDANEAIAWDLQERSLEAYSTVADVHRAARDLIKVAA